MIFFTILSFCSYFISRSKYLEAKKKHSDLDFIEVPFVFVLLHWLLYCSEILLVVFIILCQYYDNILVFELLMFSGIFPYLVLLVTFIKEGDNEVVQGVFSKYETYYSYENETNYLMNQFPYLEIMFKGFTEGESYYNCKATTKIIYSTNATTTYQMPTFEDNSWIQVKLNITYSNEIQEYIKSYNETYQKHLPKIDQKGRKIFWNCFTGLKMYTNDKIRFIKRKELSENLSNKMRIVMTIFGCGISYIYRLVSIPIYTVIVNKTNINMKLDEINENDQLFKIIELTKCS